MKYNLLDCTLRDGGYYTNWDFAPELVQKYLQTIADLPIDYIEIGYRNPLKPGYAGQYFYLPEFTVDTFNAHKLAHGYKLAIMLDAKSCHPQDVPNLLADCQGIVDLVRMAVDPAKLEPSIALAQAVKELGFAVALNLMYLSRLGDNHEFLLNLKPLDTIADYIYLVDSYGACFPRQVAQAIRFAKNQLPQKIGFHGHDNMNLAFANSLAALDAGADIVDSTVLGMGRGAGNLRTELMIAYAVKSLDEPFDLSSLADLLEPFQVLKDRYGWGSRLPYILSGLADLPQKEVMEWLGKKRHSTSTIVQTLQGKQHQILNCQSYPQLSDQKQQLGLQNSKSCVIVGGGNTAIQHHHAIVEYARHNQSLLIHSSWRNAELYANAKVAQILCLPGREAEKLKKFYNEQLEQQFVSYVVSSSPRISDVVMTEIAAQTVEVDPFMKANDRVTTALIEQDSPLGLALGVVLALGIRDVSIAGFDGYPTGDEIQQELAKEVQYLLNLFAQSYSHTQIQSLTPTHYSVTQSSVYALLSIQSGEKIHGEVFV